MKTENINENKDKGNKKRNIANTINTCKPINENKDKENKAIQYKHGKT